MLGIVQPLVSPNGLLAAYTSTNTMIIIDSASNIDRIVEILHELDVADRERGIEVMRLNYAFATEIAATLAQVLEEPSNAAPTIAGGAAGGAAPAAAAPGGHGARRARQPVQPARPRNRSKAVRGAAAYKIIPDERTNALIVVAGPLQMRKIKDLVLRLDVPLPFGTGRIHVYYLKYANAFEIVPVLSDLIGGGQGAGGLARAPRPRRGRHRPGSAAAGSASAAASAGWGRTSAAAAAAAAAVSAAARQLVSAAVRGRTSAAASAAAATCAVASSARWRGGGFGGGRGGVASVTGGQSEQFEGIVRISGDPSTNALIINASPQDYETLKQVIVQLDVRRRQVYIEAIIMEVRLDTTAPARHRAARCCRHRQWHPVRPRQLQQSGQRTPRG